VKNLISHSDEIKEDCGFAKKVFRIFGTKRDEVTRSNKEEAYMISNFTI
jgi:hypothetical protein